VTAKPFRFGVFGETARSREALLDTARRAEESGYATYLIRDHFIEEPFGHQLAPLTALATVAAVTNTLRVGTLVLSNDYRHPVILSMVVTVVISERRQQAAEQLARERGWGGVSVEKVLEMPSVFIGSMAQIVEEMQARREQYGFSYYVLFDHAIDEVAPIVARLAGK
jgi:luciferase-like monooxygenase